MFAAQESIRLGAEIDLDQFRRSLLAPAEEHGEAAERRQRTVGDDDQMVVGGDYRRAPSRLRRVPFSARILMERLSGKSIFEASHYRESNLTRLVNLFAHVDVERWRRMRCLEVGAGQAASVMPSPPSGLTSPRRTVGPSRSRPWGPRACIVHAGP